MSPRSLPHTTAGSLVYQLYFLTNHSQPCSNRAGFPVIGQFCHLSIQHGGGGVLFCKVCVGALHIEKFRETHQDVIVSLLEEKDVLVSQPTASEKYVIFIPPRSCASSMLRRWVWFTSCSLATTLLNSLIQDRARVFTSIAFRYTSSFYWRWAKWRKRFTQERSRGQFIPCRARDHGCKL